ncbi:MAG TPA: metal ABC transporter permease [Thermotogota bacterium]|nr:metal ABC transporter permease [Thermotogota bacterium]HPJ87663.1 metal ABC transporter permease [Thermotogota bacterium]HPR94898.1 metal ABC transporter permease [Thermotogota bacterium]
MIEAILKYTFMQNAFYASILASIICGIIGTIVVEKKLVMMSGGIAHTAFGGIGLGYFLGIEPMIGALFFTGVSSVLITSIKRKTNTNPDTVIGILWSVGMALGILFIFITPGYPPDMTSYLFGDILTATRFDIWMILILVIFITFSIFAFFNKWRSFLFDDEFTFVIGINTVFMEYFMFFLIALTVVALIRVVGIILVISLLTVPTAIAKFFTYDLKKIMFLSSIIGMLFSISGLTLSYYLNIPSGAMIILLSGGAFFITAILRRNKKIT